MRKNKYAWVTGDGVYFLADFGLTEILVAESEFGGESRAYPVKPRNAQLFGPAELKAAPT